MELLACLSVPTISTTFQAAWGAAFPRKAPRPPPPLLVQKPYRCSALGPQPHILCTGQVSTSFQQRTSSDKENPRSLTFYSTAASRSLFSNTSCAAEGLAISLKPWWRAWEWRNVKFSICSRRPLMKRHKCAQHEHRKSHPTPVILVVLVLWFHISNIENAIKNSRNENQTVRFYLFQSK